MSRLNEIINYFKEDGFEDYKISSCKADTKRLSMLIAFYAHRNQKRENGEPYVNHPLRLYESFRKFLDLDSDNSLDMDLMFKFSVQYDGVEEVCLLHDVVEDTDFTIGDISEIFNETGHIDYFNLFIKMPLELITHKKSNKDLSTKEWNKDYDNYISLCLKHPTSALVKMLDLEDNLNVFGLNNLSKYKYNRCKKYLKYIYIINKEFHFLERRRAYFKALGK